MADGQVVFEISADKKKAYAAIDDVTNALKKAGIKWEQDSARSTGAIGDQFKATFGAIAASGALKAAGKAIIDFGKSAIEAASDLQEVQNVVDVTFGDNAGKIESWAKSAGAQFGLTELQAKQFTSTLGAMMKSSGLAGDEIVGMSTDLAGLAADMASFYNLDFDTAFQKIRAGISGETEPLKQLGVNMSVANLEAYALTQGITKSFDAMTQGEQTMLRYQYLMQATSDAQGDFARTADESFANVKRRLSTALSSISSDIGSLFIDKLTDAGNALAGFLEEIAKDKPNTVLDDFAEIDLKTSAKLAEINETANQAKALLTTLHEINNYTGLNTDSDVNKYMNALTAGINELDEAAKKEGTIGTNLGNLAGGLNPTVDGTIGDKVAEVTGSIGDLEKKLDESDVSGGIAGLAEDIDPEVKGDFAAAVKGVAGAIDTLDTAAADAGTTVKAVKDVAGAVNALPDDTAKGAAVAAVADGINKLDAGKDVVWGAMYTVLSNIDGLGGIFTKGAADNVSALATALSTDAPDSDKAAAWQTFLDALGTNAGALSALTGQSAEGAAEWLGKVKSALDQAKLDQSNVDAWEKLLGVFAEGLSEENKGKFTDTIVESLLAMGNKSEYAREALAALGFESDDIAHAQEQWLLTCQRLVQTIPGLSSIINTQTGEVEGGADAVKDYISAWEEGQKKLTFMSALQQKQSALAQKFSELPNLELDMRVAEYRVKAANKTIEDTWKKYGDAITDWFGSEYASGIQIGTQTIRSKDAKKIGMTEEERAAYNEVVETYRDLTSEYEKASEAYNRQKEAYDYAVESMKDYEDMLDEMPDGIEEAAQSMTILQKAASGEEEALNSVATAVKNAQDALQDLADYQDNARSQTEQTVKAVVDGFNKIVTPAQKARNEVKELNAALGAESDKKKKEEIQKKLDAAKKQVDQGPTIYNMTEGLRSQLTYMREYQKMLTDAREMGVSDQILNTLFDGSQESYDYLYALTQQGGSAEDIKALNEMYKKVQEEAEGFTSALTDQKLAVDSTYQSLVEKAQEAVSGLNMGDAAYQSVAETMDAIIKACGDKSEAIKTAVDGIAAQLQRLTQFGFTGLGGISFGPGIFSYGSHANGIDHVPYDGYLAVLHQGERIQTAAEADLARRYSYQQPGFDYASMGGAIGSNISRGNVYLDGRTVGEVLSSRQANSYRAMERSGWQG